MSVSVTHLANFGKRLQDRGVIISDSIYLLPTGIESEASETPLHRNAEALTIRKLLASVGIPCMEPDIRGVDRYVVNRSADWIGPTIFISAAALSSNPHLISIGLNVLSNYLYDRFRGRDAAVKLRFVVEEVDNHRFMQIDYEGDVAGVEKLGQLLNRSRDD